MANTPGTKKMQIYKHAQGDDVNLGLSCIKSMSKPHLLLVMKFAIRFALKGLVALSNRLKPILSGSYLLFLLGSKLFDTSPGAESGIELLISKIPSDS